jgi:hypothetical protein
MKSTAGRATIQAQRVRPGRGNAARTTPARSSPSSAEANLDGDTGDVDLCRGNDLDHSDLRQVVVGQDHDIAVSIVPANAPDVPAPHHILAVDQQHELGISLISAYYTGTIEQFQTHRPRPPSIDETHPTASTAQYVTGHAVPDATTVQVEDACCALTALAFFRQDDHDSLHLFQRADRILPHGWCLLPPLQTCSKGNAPLPAPCSPRTRRTPPRCGAN